MKSSDIQPGHFYVNDSRGLVREVVAVHGPGQVEYFSYWLSDGSCDGILGVCQKRTLATWASREATADEIARLKRDDAKKRSEDLDKLLRAELSKAAATLAADDPFKEYFPDGFTIRDEANALVAWAFRNGPLEDLHAGQYSELLEDPSLSRITDDEMKLLMLHACRELSKLLTLKMTDPAKYEQQVKSYNWRYCRQWER